MIRRCSMCSEPGHHRQTCKLNPYASKGRRAALLAAREGLTLADAGRRLGISREAVRQGRASLAGKS